MTETERFWSRVDVRGPDECWPWNGASTSAGYGYFRIGSLTDGSRRMILAHRYACKITHGLADNRQALHRCDYKPCCNPAHVYPGTHTDNMNDAKERGLMHGFSLPGERNPKAKLSVADVLAIRGSNQKNADLARAHRVSRAQIGHIKKRKSWAHVA
jgi:hypothetical protein